MFSSDVNAFVMRRSGVRVTLSAPVKSIGYVIYIGDSNLVKRKDVAMQQELPPHYER